MYSDKVDELVHMLARLRQMMRMMEEVKEEKPTVKRNKKTGQELRIEVDQDMELTKEEFF